MKLYAFVLAVAVVALCSLFGQPAYASSLKVAPLEYRTTLKTAEKKKGFIDISNPTPTTIQVTVSVQGFRYIDDKPTLQFFDDEQLSKGVKTDLTQFKLGGFQALRMYFLVDGLKLPTGDVYAAIFFTTQPTRQPSGVNQRVKVGTLLSIVNGTPGARKADITGLRVPFIQIGDTIEGAYTLFNPADPKKNTGFYPSVTLKLWPGGKERKENASLLFAGRSRTNDFSYEDIGFGLYKLDVSYQGKSRSALVLVLSKGVLALILLAVAIVALEVLLYKRRQKKIHHL